MAKKSTMRRVKTLPAMTMMEPFIMVNRVGAQNFITDRIPMTRLEAYLKEKQEEGMTNLSMMHVLIAAYVRMTASRPAVNRFIRGQRIWTRDEVEIALVIKQEMTLDSPDTMIKVAFDQTDTATTVYEKFEKVAADALAKETNFDKTAKLLSHIPGLLLRFAVGFLRFLDYFGWLPKKLLNVSPFHGSFIITSMGSWGINAIYHHLYDFGNLPVFLSYGKRYSKMVLNEDGTSEKRYFATFRVVTDERICDGYYYASAFKLLKRYIKHPELLDTPLESYTEDVD